MFLFASTIAFAPGSKASIVKNVYTTPTPIIPTPSTSRVPIPTNMSSITCKKVGAGAGMNVAQFATKVEDTFITASIIDSAVTKCLGAVTARNGGSIPTNVGVTTKQVVPPSTVGDADISGIYRCR
eukprot:GHVH01015191.1.p1 GENE.GHVH01015191.1~~GHVH01015191.1.p1  ORF type:complete len:147 (-),score=7.23 GHVH01015191.1:211-588(-)